MWLVLLLPFACFAQSAGDTDNKVRYITTYRPGDFIDFAADAANGGNSGGGGLGFGLFEGGLSDLVNGTDISIENTVDWGNQLISTLAGRLGYDIDAIFSLELFDVHSHSDIHCGKLVDKVSVHIW